MAYTGPDFVNGGPPAINASNLNGMVTEIERCSALGDEVTDAKVGADGKTYNTLGNAIRGQINEINDTCGNEIFYSEPTPASKWTNGLLTASHGTPSSTSASKYLRTAYFSADDIYGIEIQSGYKYEVFAYTLYEGTYTYVGIWQGSLYAKVSNYDDEKIYFKDLGDYYFRMTIHKNDDSDISPADGAKLSFIYSNITRLDNKIDNTQEEIEAEIDNVNDEISLIENVTIDIVHDTINFSEQTMISGIVISAAGKWASSTLNRTCYIIPVRSNTSTVDITANSTEPANYAFLTSNRHVNGENAAFCEGTELKALAAGLSVTENVPTTCKYLYVVRDFQSSPSAGGAEHFRLPDDVMLTSFQPKESEDSKMEKNVLNGKKWVSCGDSFTQGDFSNAPVDNWHITEGKYAGQKKVYPYIIGNRNNMTIVNEAISGSCMTHIDGRTNAFSDTRYTQIPDDADYITLKFGINDDSSHQNVPIGTIDDNTNTTFYGAWNVVMQYLIEHHLQAKIGIIITNGSKLDIVNATIAIAEKWGIPYLNEATDKQCSYMFRSNRTDVLQSVRTLRNEHWYVSNISGSLNYHPNADAHEYESTVVEAWLKTL